MSDLNHTIATLGELIGFDTVSSVSNLKMIDYLAERLETLGADVIIQKDATGTKANIFATLGPDIDGGIVLSGHTDVVPVEDQDWSSDPFDMVERDGKLFGRGTCDMKGFIAACLVKAKQYAQLDLKIPVHFAFTYDEEIGCLGGQALVADLVARGLKPSMAIIGEPTEMRIINGHKGCRETHTRFLGLEGHSSQPDLGVNAVEYAVRFSAKLMELREVLKTRVPKDSPFDPPWTTVGVGKLTGGIASNVIPGTAAIEWDLRTVQDSDAVLVDETIATYVNDVLIPEMQAISPDAGIVTEIIGDVVGLTPMPESAAVELIASLTGSNATDVVAFGTEAGIFQKAGVSAVVCGPGSIAQAHKPDEFIEIDQLDQCLKMLGKLTDRLI